MNTSLSFGDQLCLAVRQKQSAVCVGLDPRWDSLPKILRSGINAADLASVTRAMRDYCKLVIDAVAPIAPVLKPQAAFFEQLGPLGMTLLGEIILYSRQAGLIVLLDGKRGDIGSTAQGYAEGYLGRSSAWGCDALTINPYLGEDTLEPFFQVASSRAAGVFVLVKTSNPGSRFIQDLSVDHQTVYQRVAAVVQKRAADTAGSSGYGCAGAVVGATYPQQLAEMRQAMPNAWLLIPGFGAQGGTAQDVQPGFDSQGLGAIVNSSRGIIFAYQQPEYQGMDWQEAVARAARQMSLELPKPSMAST